MHMKAILTLIMVCAMLQTPEVPKRNALPDELYLQQQTDSSCTLCASTMMVRNALYSTGCEEWRQVDEADISVNAWCSDGLLWNWNYASCCGELTVTHMSLEGATQKQLQNILEEHPEGIVLYCGGAVHHGVFLTRYADGIFYCADPARGYAGTEIPLEDSLLGARIGGENAILAAVTAYWYVE
jgi:hypothetical protein